MSDTAGQQFLSVYVTDVSGSPVSGIVTGWTYDVFINGAAYNPGTVTVYPVTSDPGMYQHAFPIIPTGSGHVRIQRSPFTVEHASPYFYKLNETTYSVDSVYSRFLSPVPISTTAFAPATVSLQLTTSDDLFYTTSLNMAQIDPGYSFAGSISGASFTVGSHTPLITGGTVTINNVATNTIQIYIPDTLLPNSLVPPGGQPSAPTAGTPITIPFNVQATSPTDKELTVLKINLTLLYNNNPATE